MMVKFKVLIADKMAQEGIDVLLKQYHDFEVVVNLKHTEDELIQLVPTFHAIIVRGATKLTEKIITAASNLKVVARAGTGYDNIDVKACSKRKIAVLITPAGNSNAVVELTIGLLLSWARHIPAAHQSMVEGRWDKSKLEGTELKGKVLGIIGLGRIGAGVAKCGQAFGMKTIGYDKYISAEQGAKIGVEMFSDFVRFITLVDYVTIHVPLTDETKNMINYAVMKTMKKNALIINISRGEVVNEADLVKAVAEKLIGGAFLELFSKEPAMKAHFPFIGMENVIVTPHLGASTAEAQTNVAILAADQIAQYLLTGKLIDCVNTAALK